MNPRARRLRQLLSFTDPLFFTIHRPLSAFRLHLALILLAACAISLAQTPNPPTNRNLIVLDPAHGGQDHGGTLNGALEKDLTLSLAAALRASLVARGLTVVSTRDADLPAGTPLLSTDERAAAANHLHPLACIVVHATALGSGVHIATSALEPPQTLADATAAVSWDAAQTAYIPQSLRLANSLGLAFLQVKLPVLLTRTALRPLDNLTCPAVALEIAPLQPSGGRSTPVSDPAYQRRLAETLATALVTWRNRTAAAAGPGANP